MLSLERDKPVQLHISKTHHGTDLQVRTLDIFFFPLLPSIMRTAPASDKAALVYDRTLERHRYAVLASATLSPETAPYEPLTSWPFS